jgi:hypothetical protein
VKKGVFSVTQFHGHADDIILRVEVSLFVLSPEIEDRDKVECTNAKVYFLTLNGHLAIF